VPVYLGAVDLEALRELDVALGDFREVGGAIGGEHYDLAVDDRGACVDQVGVGGDLLESLRPVVAAPGEDANVDIPQVRLNAKPSNLISRIQRLPAGTFSIDVASAGSINPGKGGFDANRFRFLALKRHTVLHATPTDSKQ